MTIIVNGQVVAKHESPIEVKVEGHDTVLTFCIDDEHANVESIKKVMNTARIGNRVSVGMYSKINGQSITHYIDSLLIFKHKPFN